MPDSISAALAMPFVASTLRLALIGLLALIALRGLRLATRQTQRWLESTTRDADRLSRLKTLVQLGRSVIFVLILITTVMMILHVLDVNIAPLLAGVGVAGLALSLSAQTLLKDFINGILILIEDQFSIGDVIQVGEVAGGVERMTLRATYLRDIEGKLHLVPNGDIRLVSNITAGWARAIVDLNVDYQANMGAVMSALETAAGQAQADEAIKADLLEPPQVLGWIGLTDWAVKVRLMAKTLPGKQWGVMMALRRYAVESLQAAGIRVALPAQHVRLEKPENAS